MSVTKINTKQLGSNELVFTEGNLLAGNNIEIAEVLPEGGIDNHTLAVFHFENTNDVAENAVEDGFVFTNGNTGTAQVTYDYGSKFGSGVCRFYNSNAAGYIRNTNKIGNSDFTVDFWTKFVQNSGRVGVANSLTSNSGVGRGVTFMYDKLLLSDIPNSSYINQASPFETPYDQIEWHHCAYVQEGRNYRVYINGVKKAEGTYSTFSQYDELRVWGWGNALIDEVRISNVARYDADFTPPTKPYSLAIPTGKKQINFTGEIPNISSLATKEEINTVKNDLNSLGDQVSTIESKIPTDASDTNQLATKQQVDQLSTSVTTLENTTSEIEAKIPDTATSENKLVTKSQMDEAIAGAGSGGSGTSDYSALTNKPQINSVELSGNKTLSDLGIQPAGSYATTAQLASKVDSSALSEVALTGSYTDLVDTPVIPEAYTLPAATSSTLGGVKVDGTTITVDDAGTISASGSASGFTCTFRDWTETVTYQINPAITNNSSWSFDSTTGIITGNDSMSYLTVPSGWFTSGTTMVIAFTYATTSHWDGQQLLHGSGNDLDIYIGNNSSNLSSYGSLYSGTLFSLSTGVNYLLKLEHNSSSNTLTFSHSTDDGQAWNQDASSTTSINDSSFTLGRSSRPWAGTINLAKSYVLSSSGVYTYFAVPV